MYHNPFPPCAKALGSRARTRSHTKARSSPSSARRHANGRKSASAHSAVTPTRHNEGAAGIKVPEQRTVVSKGGRRYKLADFAEGERLADWWRAKGRTEAEREAMRAKLRAGLDVDAMLGNWDVIGMGGDNILVDKDGEPWRIDNGGALGFRAQGARKADADWKDGWPNELFTIAGSANNAPYVGGTSSLTLIRQAAARDWEKVIVALPDQADRDALARRVAEMRQLAKFAELATLPHIDTSINDKNARTVKLLHTEARVVVAAKPQKGKAYDYSMGPSESYSWHRTVLAFGEYATIAEVPWSRINAAYFMERTPGEHDDLFLGDGESEFNVDGIGLRRVFCERSRTQKPCKSFCGLL